MANKVREIPVDVDFLRKYVPSYELNTLLGYARGKSKSSKSFIELLDRIKAQIKSVPPLFANEKMGLQGIVKLHYFRAGADFFISELDPKDGVTFGYACVGGDIDNAEFGYSSIKEIISIPLMELDLYWNEKTLKEVMDDVQAGR